MVQALRRFPPKPTTAAWATYLRCHDDIGWASTTPTQRPSGGPGHGHRAFLSDFYAGGSGGSFARGVVFQHNPETGDRRISGTAASLAGVEAALAHGDPGELDLALARLACAHAIVFGFGGIPLLYMGDELAMLNDRTYTSVAEHADDNRWLHRPQMSWVVAERRHDPSTVRAGRSPRSSTWPGSAPAWPPCTLPSRPSSTRPATPRWSWPYDGTRRAPCSRSSTSRSPSSWWAQPPSRDSCRPLVRPPLGHDRRTARRRRHRAALRGLVAHRRHI